MRIKRLAKPFVVAAVLATGFLGSIPAHAMVYSDFAFASGTPVSGTTTVDGVGVTLHSFNTYKGPPGYPNGIAVQFDNSRDGIPDAIAQFTFDQAIQAFSISLQRVKEGEWFTFSAALGTPSSVTGDLIEVTPGYYSVPATALDYGNGSLTWTGLAITGLTVAYQCDGTCGALPLPGNANVPQFGLEAVPLPAALPLLAGGIGVLAFTGRRRSK